MLGVIVHTGIYDVVMFCPSCEKDWVTEVHGVEALYAAIDDPLEICRTCSHAATLKTEEEWRQELQELGEEVKAASHVEYCAGCGGCLCHVCECGKADDPEAETYAEFAERTFIDPDWKVISPTGKVCTHCGGFVDVDCRCE
jgi:hypothetical protein